MFMRTLKRKSTALCNLKLYSDYLLISPKNRGCTKLSEGMEEMSHDSVLNFLMREDYESKDLYDRVSSLLEVEGGVLSVDDSIWDKPYSHPKLNSLIGRHYSGKHHKVVQGICLVSLFYTDAQGVRLPVNYRIYEQGGDKTKNEHFREMLNEVLSWGLKPRLVSGDSWYSSKDNLKWIRRKKLNAFFAVEKDRTISTQKGLFEQVEQAKIEEDGLFTHLKGFDFVTVFRKKEARKVRHYIFYIYVERGEKNIQATLDEFQTAHQNHWHIEEFHRAKKQLCNAENFLVRRTKAVKNHIFSVYWAFVSLEEMVIKKTIQNWYQLRNLIHKNIITQNLT